MIEVPPAGRDGKWVRRDLGPVVRPYAVTGGRTEPADGEVLDLVAVVVAVGRESDAGDDPIRQTPEHRKILRLCQRPVTVADIASDTALPVGVVRVLLADLILEEAVRVVRNRPAVQLPGNDVLKEILNGLRAL
ncbi:MAG TPA: DUF742 domain-containing protein [Trebonia sp.]|nr:DUF742 domain-containing protein [Trebonia sp.]